MAMRLSTGLRDALVGTGGYGFGEIMNNGWLDIYSGAQPASADYAETGTKLVRISSTSGQGATDGLKFGTAGSGVLTIGTPAWNGTIQADGVAGWARFYASSGTGGQTGTSGTAIRFDISVGVSGADLNLTHTTLDADSVITITAANITMPAS
jgi:hypothetical protein